MLVTSTSMKSFAKSPLVPLTERPLVALDESGAWKYAETDIPVVGARDVTLGDAIHPLVIARSGEEPEAVLLSLTEVESDDRLHWVFKAGTRLNGDDEPFYKVDWPTWNEHAASPVDAWLPEWDGSGLDRSLALAERRWRFAKQALDDAGVLRQYLVVLAARLGRSRRVVGETLSLSPARIQQLNEAPAAEVLADIDEFLASATRVATVMGLDVYSRDELPRPRDFGIDELEEIVDSMVAVGLMEETPEGFELTGDGRALLETKDVKRKPVDGDRDRERAGNATR
jgi:hypothetical protein